MVSTCRKASVLNEPLIQQKALFLTAHQTIRRLKAFRSRVGYTEQLIYALKAMQTYKKKHTHTRCENYNLRKWRIEPRSNQFDLARFRQQTIYAARTAAPFCLRIFMNAFWAPWKTHTLTNTMDCFFLLHKLRIFKRFGFSVGPDSCCLFVDTQRVRESHCCWAISELFFNLLWFAHFLPAAYMLSRCVELPRKLINHFFCWCRPCTMHAEDIRWHRMWCHAAASSKRQPKYGTHFNYININCKYA